MKILVSTVLFVFICSGFVGSIGCAPGCRSNMPADACATMVVKDWDVDAEAVKKVAPVYPARAASREICGWVAVIASISETGKLTDAWVCESDPPRQFDNAALTAVLAAKYAPATREGKPVQSELVLKFGFEMTPMDDW